MIFRKIEGANVGYAAPDNWNKKEHGPCAVLPVRTAFDQHKQPVTCDSAWEPTPEELINLTYGGSLVLRVFGAQPPVSMWVEHPSPDRLKVQMHPVEQVGFQRGIDTVANWYAKHGRKLHADEVPAAIRALIFTQ